MSDGGSHPYVGATFALLTQHGKERVVTPQLEAAFGARVQLVRSFDTDTLGTFTREVARAGSQLEAARSKARLGMELARLPLGLGSEGAFLPVAFGLGVIDVELVVLRDAVRGLEIVGRAEGPGRHSHGFVSTSDALAELARSAGFPQHGLVLRPDREDHPHVVKGLDSWAGLEEAWGLVRALATTGRVFVENDLRAHQNPTRMAIIHEAMRDLLGRMAAECPACGSPGFGVVEPVPGLPCRDCGSPTSLPRAQRLGCVKCPHRLERPLAAFEADPARCDHCNP